MAFASPPTQATFLASPHHCPAYLAPKPIQVLPGFLVHGFLSGALGQATRSCWFLNLVVDHSGLFFAFTFSTRLPQGSYAARPGPCFLGRRLRFQLPILPSPAPMSTKPKGHAKTFSAK